MRSLLAFVFFTCFLNCTTTKTATKEKLYFTVELKKDKDADYLDSNYSEFQVNNTRRSNRTLNEYATSFFVTEEEEAKLIEKLKLDPSVIKFRKSGEEEMKTIINDAHTVKPASKQ